MPIVRCFTPFKVKKVRFTLLDVCGAPVTSTCSTITTDGIITIEQTATYEDREEFYVKNADGKFCVQETNPPILKWIQNTITLCNVDPEVVAFTLGGSIVVDDDDTPSAAAIGNTWKSNDASLVNFGFEAWTGVTNVAPSTGGDAVTCPAQLYGYMVWPWNVEGTMGDITYENGAATLQIISRTKVGSNWGTGPYNVLQSRATATLGIPTPLLTPIGVDEHRRSLTTFEPPPIAGCGCTDLPNPALTFADTGVLIGTVTLPTTPWPTSQILPGIIDWGDSSTTVVPVGSGPTVNHTYAMAGTYTAVFKSQAVSAASWTSAATPVS